jgi:DNA-binding CsgD family transcriptional regulator|nr:MAG TPA: RNA dependent RNA polymerase [Caudoviricetes sp.]
MDLAHYGVKRRSGRYPWGSGQDPHQHSGDLLSTIKDLKAKGLSETEIAKGLGMTTTQLRAQKSIAKNEKRKADVAMVARLKEKGMSNTAIGRRMGINESSVRALLDPTLKERAGSTEALAKELKKQVGKDGLLDVGLGVEVNMGVTSTKMKTATAMLEAEGYHVHKVKVQQQTTGKFTEMKVLVPPGMDYKTVLAKRGEIKAPGVNIEDRGRTVYGIEKPTAVSSKRLKVRYGNEGGTDMDGVIELRRNVKDLSLGGSNYAQVRISIDGTHFLKGMAMYSDDLPKGYDIRFNTNKKPTGNKLDALKPMKDDPANPFGAVIRRQMHYESNGKKKLSAINIVNDEGTWGDWSKTLSSQFLSKQPVSLAKQQLKAARDKRKAEFEEIMALTNPSVKKKLLQSFADSVDSDAVDLKAAALPRQASQVILPVPKMKPTEVYAPNFKHGEKVVLVRHPHGGRFEIPELTVNNKNPHARKTIGTKVKDAIGIHPKVAERLSGADFDGDSVLCIPNNSGKVKTSPALKGLNGFDPKAMYPEYPGMKLMTSKQTQLKMGEVSNLITDMTIKGATQSEIARAVRHSMVVIDAEKHHLNYKQSEIDNGIAALKKKYQGRANAGASTLISRASSKVYVPDRKPRSASKGGGIDKKTGRKVWEETGKTYKKPVFGEDGETIVGWKTEKSILKSKKLAETNDAFSLVSKDGSTIETVYANHANELKAMANEARKATLSIPSVRKNPQAAKTYAPEVKSLKAKVNEALRNKPRERQAQVLADAVVRAKKQADPTLAKDKERLKKVRRQALAEARSRTGAGKKPFSITPQEWRAIQEGAVSQAALNKVLELADESVVRELATPRAQPKISSSMVSRAKAMSSRGKTAAEIAEALGISTTSVHRALEEG